MAASASKIKPYPAPWRSADTVPNPKTFVHPRPIAIPSESRLGFFKSSSAQAKEAASDLLNYNHKTFHIFFNEKGFHNHLSHHVLAALSIGTPSTQFAPIYQDTLRDYLDPSFYFNRKPDAGDASHPEITRDNWSDQLSKYKNYWGYLQFYESEIERLGSSRAAIREYVFSPQANNGGKINMLARLIGGAVHPLIHIGYGLEFNLDGIVAEGLAMTSITEGNYSVLFEHSQRGVGQPSGNLSLFDVLQEMANDQGLDPGKAVKFGADSKIGDVLRSKHTVQKIAHYADQWKLTENDGQSWEERFEELAWFVMLLLGATTRPGFKLRHNFFLMHAHNGLLFLPVILPELTPAERLTLLDAFFRLTLVMWISNGRPRFYINDRLMAGSDMVKSDGSDDHDGTSAITSDPTWAHVLNFTSTHLDEHYVKATRTLAWFSNKYAHRKKGSFSSSSSKGTNLFDGIESLDGTAFLRTAIQLYQIHGKDNEGWDFDGVGFDEVYSSKS